MPLRHLKVRSRVLNVMLLLTESQCSSNGMGVTYGLISNESV